VVHLYLQRDTHILSIGQFSDTFETAPGKRLRLAQTELSLANIYKIMHGKGRKSRGRRRMRGGSSMLAGYPISGGVTSGQMYGAQAVQRGGDGLNIGDNHGMANPLTNAGDKTMQQGGVQPMQQGGAYQMIVPAALVLANNVMGRGRSMRYKGKGGLSRGSSSRFSRRRRSGSRRR